jgi:predicted AAA+ superfamily ATPase
VLIGEFQYAKEPLLFIKIHADESGVCGSCWFTGPQMLYMMQGVSESLAGRAALIPMQSLSHSEAAGLANTVFTGSSEVLMAQLRQRSLQSLQRVFDRIFKGSVPRMQQEGIDRELFYSSYADTYLQRDLRDLRQAGDESACLRFMAACAARTGQQVNYK